MPGIDDLAQYTEIGYPVFPCRGKIPLTRHGVHDAKFDWNSWPTGANIAIHCLGIIVIDVDAGASWPPKSVDTPMISITPRGGRHYYFRAEPDSTIKNSVSALAPNVDVRTDGGYVIAPPSIVSGIEYR